jgi:hypothetical protein
VATLTVSEKVSLGKALEELERPKAKERQGTRTDLAEHSENFTEGSRPPVRELVGAALGMSGGADYVQVYDHRRRLAGRPGTRI